MAMIGVYLTMCVVAQAGLAWLGRSAPARFLLSLLGGVLAIVVFQALAYLQAGHVDPFIWIAVSVQIVMMLPVAVFVFLVVNALREAPDMDRRLRR